MTVRSLPSLLQNKAEKELNEDSDRIESDIIAFREWLDKQTHLDSVVPTDQWLLTFLRGSKFSLERCKEKFDMYYTLKAVIPEIFSQRDPFDYKIQEILRAGVFLPVRRTSGEDSCRIILVRYGAGAAAGSHFLLADLIKVSLMIVEILMLEDDNFVVAGEVILVDMKNMGLNIISQWTPALAKKVIKCFEEALPIRMKGIHVLNTMAGYETAFNIFKAFAGNKIRERFFVYGKESAEIYKTIPKSVLPVEYGGKDADISDLIDHWKSKVESYRPWFLAGEAARAEDGRRCGARPDPTAAAAAAAMFGVEGSFRRLAVD